MAANETAKTRLQLQGQDPVQRYQGLGHCIATIVRKVGTATLYRGLTTTMVYQTILLSLGCPQVPGALPTNQEDV